MSTAQWGFPDWGEKKTLQLVLILAGVAAMVSSATVLIIAHFIYKRRSKLAHLATDTEPSQHYEVVIVILMILVKSTFDLCNDSFL